MSTTVPVPSESHGKLSTRNAGVMSGPSPNACMAPANRLDLSGLAPRYLKKGRLVF